MTVRVVDGRKPCSRCKMLLPVACFAKAKDATSGLACECRQCNAADRLRRGETRMKRERYHADPAVRRRTSLQSMKWTAAHRDKSRAYQRAYAERQRAKIVVVELEDMLSAAQQIVAAGAVIAGTVPSGLTKKQLMVWLARFVLASGKPQDGV